MSYSDDFLRTILTRTRTVAVVGVSMNPVRPSYYVARYLSLKGMTVIPVNPGHTGKMLFGQRVVGRLNEIEARGVDVILDRCPKIEYQRLFGELRMGGFNTGVISSRL